MLVQSRVVGIVVGKFIFVVVRELSRCKQSNQWHWNLCRRVRVSRSLSNFWKPINFKYPFYLSSKIGRTKREKRQEKMDSSSQEGEEKIKITEVKTFSVPFALGEIKEKISISISKGAKNYLAFPNYDRFLRQNPQVFWH